MLLLVLLLMLQQLEMVQCLKPCDFSLQHFLLHCIIQENLKYENLALGSGN